MELLKSIESEIKQFTEEYENILDSDNESKDCDKIVRREQLITKIAKIVSEHI